MLFFDTIKIVSWFFDWNSLRNDSFLNCTRAVVICNVVQRCDRTNIDVLGLRGLKKNLRSLKHQSLNNKWRMLHFSIYSLSDRLKRSVKLSHMTLGASIVPSLVVCLILKFNCSNKSRIWKNIKQTQVHRANLEQHFFSFRTGNSLFFKELGRPP